MTLSGPSILLSTKIQHQNNSALLEIGMSMENGNFCCTNSNWPY